jgi:hypothetical protein
MAINGAQGVEPDEYMFCGPQGRPISDAGCFGYRHPYRGNAAVFTQFTSSFRIPFTPDMAESSGNSRT